MSVTVAGSAPFTYLQASRTSGECGRRVLGALWRAAPHGLGALPRGH